MVEISREKLAKMIDFTLLKPNATRAEILSFLGKAKENNFIAVCINPFYVPLAKETLKGAGIKVCTVIGFPLGANTSAVKAFEAKNAIENGADEIDMMINISALKSGDYDYVRDDIRSVVKTDSAYGKITKVIIEAAYLTDEEKIKACELAKETKADFVKTSTGFGPGGARIEDVKLMRKAVGNEMGVKAAGGIGTFSDALNMIEAGATRIGASKGVEILLECPEK